MGVLARAVLIVIPSKPLLRSEGSGRAARTVASSRATKEIARLARFLIKLRHYFANLLFCSRELLRYKRCLNRFSKGDKKP
jgi:hypothetical protein